MRVGRRSTCTGAWPPAVLGREAAPDLGLFMLWLRHAPSRRDGGSARVVQGPGAKSVRQERRVNGVLTATRGLLSHAVSVGQAPRSVLGQIYELADNRDLPEEGRGRGQRADLPAGGPSPGPGAGSGGRPGLGRRGGGHVSGLPQRPGPTDRAAARQGRTQAGPGRRTSAHGLPPAGGLRSSALRGPGPARPREAA